MVWVQAPIQMGQTAALKKVVTISSTLEGTDMVFVTVGWVVVQVQVLRQLVAEIAKEMGILTVGVVKHRLIL